MRFVYAVAVGIVVLGFAGILTAANSNNPNAEFVPLVQPAPMAPKRPIKIALTAGAFACAQIKRTDGGSNPGQCLRIYCSVDCEYDVGAFLPDGGISRGDGSYNTDGDGNPLSYLSAEGECLTAAQDGICIFAGDGGTAYVSPRWP